MEPRLRLYRLCLRLIYPFTTSSFSVCDVTLSGEHFAYEGFIILLQLLLLRHVKMIEVLLLLPGWIDCGINSSGGRFCVCSSKEWSLMCVYVISERLEKRLDWEDQQDGTIHRQQVKETRKDFFRLIFSGTTSMIEKSGFFFVALCRRFCAGQTSNERKAAQFKGLLRFLCFFPL